mmetsp:Transcript_7178/g.20836  ORF Transcript_7178/g.20836 Transcript_7178/m.20836 type:complete len:593 (-) Transcript_7178:186-1964(-)
MRLVLSSSHGSSPPAIFLLLPLLVAVVSALSSRSSVTRNPNPPGVLTTNSHSPVDSKSSTTTTTTTTNSYSDSDSNQKQPGTIPMPFQWPVIGNLPDFYARGGVDGMCDVYESLYRDYGPVFGLDLVAQTVVAVADPRVYDQVLRREGRFPYGATEAVTTFKDYYDENDLPMIAEASARISEVAGREITTERTLSFKDFISRSSFDMFSAVLFGKSPQTTNSRVAMPEDLEFVRATQTAFDVTGYLMTNPLEKLNPFGSELYETFVVSMDKTFAMGSNRATTMAEAALETQQKAKGESETSGCPISALKKSTSKKKNLLGRNKVIPTEFPNPSYIERLVDRGFYSTDELGELIGPLLMAGVDTTAYVMGWFYLNLASNPDVQDKLVEELETVLGGADATTPEQLNALSYLAACVRESHRLTPAAPILTKKIDTDIKLVTTPLGGGDDDDGDDDSSSTGTTTTTSYSVPAGESIVLNLRAVPMDPRFVDDPHEFRPERFLPDAVEARRGTTKELLDHPYLATPFGRGKRKCIGANVATAEIFVLAARLVQDWEIRLEDPSQAVSSPTKTWKPKQKLMLVADPYPNMVLTPRNK